MELAGAQICFFFVVYSFHPKLYITRKKIMPALKMKTATNLICSSEGSGLGVCQKSSKISKNSCSQVRISLQAEDLQSSTQSNEDFSSNIELFSSENESCDEALDPDIFDGEIYHCRSSPLSGFGPSDIVEFLPDACSSDYGTIFLPLLESIEHHGQWDVHNYAAVDNGHTDSAQSKDDDDNGSSNSCDYEACNVLDLRISDMIVAGLA
ncbi:hypothetical protein ACQCRO_27590, partial [Ralstonia pseudosolanacearum]|uniref:hypothetical protein n=1 Tax=Ralstonia pseudosolanacearum TaxID=1310165 RepID=UPI003CF38C2A